MDGALLIALVFLASGATMVKNARTPASASEAEVAGSQADSRKGIFSAMPSGRRFGFGVFMLFLGALFVVYWLVSRR